MSLIEFSTGNVNLTNCICTNDLSNIDNKTDVTFELVANVGYEFNDPPRLVLTGLGGSQSGYFVISEDKQTASVFVPLSQSSINFRSGKITAVADAKTSYGDIYGAINVYRVTNENLNALAQLRYRPKTDETNYLDTADYIVSLKRFSIPETEYAPNKISMANFTTNIDCETPLNDIISVNCGELILPLFNNSSLDFDKTEINIFLPFIGFRSLSNVYLGKAISLQYDINIVLGSGVAKLICDDIIMDVYECTPSTELLFKPLNYTQSEVNKSDKKILGLVPYVVVKYYTANNVNKTQINNKRIKLEVANISNLGVFKATDLTFVTSSSVYNLTPEIENEIKSLFAQGVRYNDGPITTDAN